MSSMQRLQLFYECVSYIAYSNTVIAELITRQMYEMLRHPVPGALNIRLGLHRMRREAKPWQAFRERSAVYTSLDLARMRSMFRLLNE